jgi:hypothetical protein
MKEAPLSAPGDKSPRMKIREAADWMIVRGWYPIPLRSKTKECRDSDWRDRVYVAEEFNPDDNIGIRLIKASDERSNKVVGIDADASEVVAVLGHFLPQTRALWGRETKQISQLLYLSKFEKPITYRDIETGKTLVEIRVDHQSMAPPSVHPNGEQISWVLKTPWEKIELADITAAEIDSTVLLHSVQLIATCALIARYYNPPGNRHEWTLVMSGVLREFDISEDECRLIFERAAKLAKDDKIKDRLVEIRSTYQKGEDDPVAGSGKLGEYMDTAKTFLESLRKIWGERKSDFITTAKGTIIPGAQSNIRRALDKLSVRLYWDEFALRLRCSRNDGPLLLFSNAELNKIRFEIEERFHFMPTKDIYQDLVEVIGRENPIHPVKKYLESLVWDKVPRVDTWLSEYGGAANTELNREMGKLVLLAAVQRIFDPGKKFDELLILESSQGQNKSTMLETLVGNRAWFSDDLPLGVDAQKIIERTSGKWIIESSDLHGIRTPIEKLKAFLSRQVDGPARKVYAHLPDEIPRQFIVIGTTNSNEYLRDINNRRFWPVTVKYFDIDKIKTDRDQLWAEATERRNESIRMDSKFWELAETEQDARRETHPWEDKLYEYFWDEDQRDKEVNLEDTPMWSKVGISDISKLTLQDKRNLSDALAKFNIFKKVVWDKEKNKSVRRWYRAPKQQLL